MRKENEFFITDEEETGEDFPIEYGVNSSPNDFNLSTLFDFMEKGVIKLPDFQRNYVWDLKRASKLIESLIMGLPIPQIFLYEGEKNKFDVIDGQQRLMTIYYFIKRKFPRLDKRTELRKIFDERGKIPDEILQNKEYFVDFNLKFQTSDSNYKNRLDGRNYSTLDEQDRHSLELRTIRNIIIKQYNPPNNDDVMYEIFYRLNTGGVNLYPQEIRASLYHSKFYEMLHELNLDIRWRNLTKPETDLHIKDIQNLLRSFAMLIEGDTYSPSLTKFLNEFSRKVKRYDSEKISYLKKLFESFLENCKALPKDTFYSQNNQFNISMFEAVFVATVREAYASMKINIRKIDQKKLDTLKKDSNFTSAIEKQTTSRANVTLRLNRAQAILFG